jgi:hypothetical protein
MYDIIHPVSNCENFMCFIFVAERVLSYLHCIHVQTYVRHKTFVVM